jgi:hypothetical protein
MIAASSLNIDDLRYSSFTWEQTSRTLHEWRFGYLDLGAMNGVLIYQPYEVYRL